MAPLKGYTIIAQIISMSVPTSRGKTEKTDGNGSHVPGNVAQFVGKSASIFLPISSTIFTSLCMW